MHPMFFHRRNLSEPKTSVLLTFAEFMIYLKDRAGYGYVKICPGMRLVSFYGSQITCVSL